MNLVDTNEMQWYAAFSPFYAGGLYMLALSVVFLFEVLNNTDKG